MPSTVKAYFGEICYWLFLVEHSQTTEFSLEVREKSRKGSVIITKRLVVVLANNNGSLLGPATVFAQNTDL